MGLINKYHIFLVGLIFSITAMSGYARESQIEVIETMETPVYLNDPSPDFTIRAVSVSEVVRGSYNIKFLVRNHGESVVEMAINSSVFSIVDEKNQSHELRVIEADRNVKIAAKEELLFQFTAELIDNKAKYGLAYCDFVVFCRASKNGEYSACHIVAALPEIQIYQGLGASPAGENNVLGIRNVSRNRMILESVTLESECLSLVDNNSVKDKELFTNGTYDIRFKVRNNAPMDADGKCQERLIIRYRISGSNVIKQVTIPIEVRKNNFWKEHKTAILVGVTVAVAVVVVTVVYYYFGNVGGAAGAGAIAIFPPDDGGGGDGGGGGGDAGDGGDDDRVLRYTNVHAVSSEVLRANGFVVDTRGRCHLPNGKFVKSSAVLAVLNREGR